MYYTRVTAAKAENMRAIFFDNLIFECACGVDFGLPDAYRDTREAG